MAISMDLKCEYEDCEALLVESELRERPELKKEFDLAKDEALRPWTDNMVWERAVRQLP